MTRRGLLGPMCVLLVATLSRAESEDAARWPAVGSPRSAGPSVKPTLEWLRDAIVKRGVPPRLVRIEHPEEGPASSSGQRPRLVFWTRTRRITQTVVVATTGDAEARYVRIQSARLGQAPADHPRLAEVMSYLLDRNFAMAGAAFARDAADGEIVLRAELPTGEGLTGDEFTRALEVLLRVADEEAPRLEGMLRTPQKQEKTEPE